MINFFKLAHNVEIAEIGFYPQIETSWPWPVDYWGERGFVNTPLRGRVREDVVFPKFRLARQAKPNDWVGDGGGIEIMYWLISAKLHHIFLLLMISIIMMIVFINFY